MGRIGYIEAMLRSGPKVWGEALMELIVIAGVSLIPLFGAAVREVLPPESTVYLPDAFTKAFLSGQLVFYALGLIATVVWQSNKDFRSFFPLRIVFNIYSIAAITISSIVIGYDPELKVVNRDFIAPFSVGVFVTSLIAYAIMAVVAKVHVNVGESLARADAQLGDAVRRSRGLN